MTDPSPTNLGPLHFQPEWCRVAFASIGDAVITTDTEGWVTFLESVAGWTQDEAAGVALQSVFEIVNRETRRTVESPTVQALRDGAVCGLTTRMLRCSG